MPLCDGIRRNLALVSDEERTRFINAIVKLDTKKILPTEFHIGTNRRKYIKTRTLPVRMFMAESVLFRGIGR